MILVGGFGDAGVPNDLIEAVYRQGASNLIMVGNGAVSAEVGHGRLMDAGRVDKFIASFPRNPNTTLFDQGTRSAGVELEIIPQGTLAERIRAGGAGIAAFYTPTAVGTPLAEGKEVRRLDGRDYVLEHAIKADVALVKAQRADRWGNLSFAKTARNFNPIIAMAADLTIVQVAELVEPGALDPELVITPGIFVDRVVLVENPLLAWGAA